MAPGAPTLPRTLSSALGEGGSGDANGKTATGAGCCAFPCLSLQGGRKRRGGGGGVSEDNRDDASFLLRRSFDSYASSREGRGGGEGGGGRSGPRSSLLCQSFDSNAGGCSGPRSSQLLGRRLRFGRRSLPLAPSVLLHNVMSSFGRETEGALRMAVLNLIMRGPDGVGKMEGGRNSPTATEILATFSSRASSSSSQVSPVAPVFASIDFHVERYSEDSGISSLDDDEVLLPIVFEAHLSLMLFGERTTSTSFRASGIVSGQFNNDGYHHHEGVRRTCRPDSVEVTLDCDELRLSMAKSCRRVVSEALSVAGWSALNCKGTAFSANWKGLSPAAPQLSRRMRLSPSPTRPLAPPQSQPHLGRERSQLLHVRRTSSRSPPPLESCSEDSPLVVRGVSPPPSARVAEGGVGTGGRRSRSYTGGHSRGLRPTHSPPTTGGRGNGGGARVAPVATRGIFQKWGPRRSVDESLLRRIVEQDEHFEPQTEAVDD